MRVQLAVALLLLTTTAHAASPKPPALRLDNTARPQRYAARVRVVPTETTFQAAIDIDLSIARPTRVLWLNGTNLTIQKAVFTVDGKKITATAVQGGDDFVGFQTAEPLPAGPAALHVDYTGSVSRKDDRGLFAQQENGAWYAITQFESIFARRVFPCFDEPGYKTPWQITLEVPKADAAISNTAPTTEREEHPGMKTLTFAATRPLPSYLVAFAVGPYDFVGAGQAGVKRIPVRIVVPHGRGPDARWAVEVTGTIVDRLEAYFGTPFPFDKLDVVAIPLPTQFSAMENPGMVTFTQNGLVARPEAESLRFKRGYVSTAAHELAHQWFGDLVTTAWWDDIWLNESFASWMENKIVDAWHPEWTHHTGLVRARGAMRTDGLMTARKIRQPILSNNDIYNAFDRITYSKGESVLGMFERYVGVDVFQRGIRAYVAKHADGNATADDFVAAIGQAAGQDLAPAWRSFLDQAGAPLVTVALQCSGKPALAVSQARYLPLGSKGPANQTWKLPLCASFPGKDGKLLRRCSMLTSQTQTIPLDTAQCPAWVMANTGGLGYYRVAYAGDGLQRLLKNLSTLTLPELLALLDDVDALVRNGTVPLGDALALVPQLAADSRREVVGHAVGIAGGIRDHIVPEALLPNYGRFVRKNFGERARQLGWLPRPGDDEDTRILRAQVVSMVAQDGHDPALRAEALKLSLKWLDDRKAVDADVIDSVLSTAARAGDPGLFERLRQAARVEKDRRDRQRMLSSLGAFIDPDLAGKALSLVLAEDVDARESTRILSSMASWPTTRPLAWDFLKKNFEAMQKRLPGETMARMPQIPASFCDEAHRTEMEMFFRDRSPKLPGGPRALAQALESTDLCRAYVTAQQASAVKFLQQY